MVRAVLALAFCVWVCSAQPSDPITHDRTPRFEDFKVKARFKGIPAKPRFTAPPELRPNQQLSENDSLPDADARYREAVEFDARRGTNFAGRYTIAKWSCGTGCSSNVVVDAGTGELYREVPYATLDLTGTKYTGLSFRVDSSLLIVEGCLDTDEDQDHTPECSRSYYNWVAPRFVLLRKVPLAVPEWLKR